MFIKTFNGNFWPRLPQAKFEVSIYCIYTSEVLKNVFNGNVYKVTGSQSEIYHGCRVACISSPFV